MVEKEEKPKSREEKIEEMHKAKQERIARQVALQCAVELLKDTSKTYKDKVEEVRDLTIYFYNWIVNGSFNLHNLDTETLAEMVSEKVIEKLRRKREKGNQKGD